MNVEKIVEDLREKYAHVNNGLRNDSLFEWSFKSCLLRYWFSMYENAINKYNTVEPNPEHALFLRSDLYYFMRRVGTLADSAISQLPKEFAQDIIDYLRGQILPFSDYKKVESTATAEGYSFEARMDYEIQFLRGS